MKEAKQGTELVQKLFVLFQKYKLVLLVLAVGMFLLLLPQEETAKAEESTGYGAELAFDLEELETRMEKVLSKIEGAGNVSLILTVKSGTEQVYATNTDYSEDGESREERIDTVLISTGSGTEEAAVVRQNYPTFQGALVVCDGGDDPNVKLLITQAVAALTGLRSDKITVCR